MSPNQGLPGFQDLIHRGFAGSFLPSRNSEPAGNSIRRLLNSMRPSDERLPLMQYDPEPSPPQGQFSKAKLMTRDEVDADVAAKTAEWKQRHAASIASPENQAHMASMTPVNRHIYQLLSQY